MQIFLSLLSILLFTSFSHAEEISVYQHCAQVNLPKNSNTILWSDDCKTVYVLPSTIIESKVNLALRPEAEAYCRRGVKNIEDYQKSMQVMLADTETTITIDVSSKDIESITSLNPDLVKRGVHFKPMFLTERYYSMDSIPNLVVYGAESEEVNGGRKLFNKEIRFTGSINANYVCANLDNLDSLKMLNGVGTATIFYDTKEQRRYGTSAVMPKK